MSWVLVLAAAWVAVAVVTGLLIGRMVHKADVREHTVEPAHRPTQLPHGYPDDAALPVATAGGFAVPAPRHALAKR